MYAWPTQQGDGSRRTLLGKQKRHNFPGAHPKAHIPSQSLQVLAEKSSESQTAGLQCQRSLQKASYLLSLSGQSSSRTSHRAKMLVTTIQPGRTANVNYHDGGNHDLTDSCPSMHLLLSMHACVQVLIQLPHTWVEMYYCAPPRRMCSVSQLAAAALG